MSDTPNFEEMDEEQRQAWRIDGKKTAAWAMEHLADYVRRQEENKAVAKDRIEAINAWCKEENDKLQGSVEHFAGALMTWHMSIVTADPDDEEEWEKEKNKTISLPDGKLTVRKGSYKTEIDDKAALHSWANLHRSDLLVVGLASDVKSRVAKHIEDTGEVPPGVTYERSQPKFDVKPKVGE